MLDINMDTVRYEVAYIQIPEWIASIPGTLINSPQLR